MTKKTTLGRPEGTTKTALQADLDARSDSEQPGADAVMVRMPPAHLRILGTEAKKAGVKRGVFLALLLNNKLGGTKLVRAADAPTYEFSIEELTSTKPWVWYMTPDVRKQVQEDRIYMGLGTTGMWATQMLNKWISYPDGLRALVRKPDQ